MASVRDENSDSIPDGVEAVRILEFLNGEIRLGNGWIYAAAFGGEDTRRKIEQRFGISLKRIPLSVDAYAVDRRVKDWLEGILK